MDVEVRADRIAQPAPLVEYLSDVLGPADRVEITALEGGNANDTLALEWDGTRSILRIPPRTSPAPELLAAMDREAAALSGVADAAVPAPTVRHHCPDPSILGQEFLVIERLPGTVLEGTLPDEVASPERRDELVTAVVDALAAIHATGPPAAFEDDPRDPADYLSTELDAFRRQLEWAEDATHQARRVEPLETLLDRLDARRPEPSTEATLVHGDFKPDNLLLVGDRSPPLAGVLDWEMAGRGDPLADLGWLLSYWRHPEDPSFITEDFRTRYADHDYFPIVETYLEEYTAFTAHPDTPGRGTIVDRYEARTGHRYRHDRFYRAFGAAKLAVICEGFFRIALEEPEHAKTSYPAMELLPFVLAEQGLRTLDGAVPLRS